MGKVGKRAVRDSLVRWMGSEIAEPGFRDDH